MIMLDEPTRRRPDFLPGSPIRLADGQLWTFPAPAHEAEFGPDYPAAIAAVDEAEDRAERLRAELALAILLLCRNYDLSPDALSGLLRYAPGNPALAQLQEAFGRLAREHAGPSRSAPDADADLPFNGWRLHYATAAPPGWLRRVARTLQRALPGAEVVIESGARHASIAIVAPGGTPAATVIATLATAKATVAQLVRDRPA
jgi:hypothetical protein